MRAILCKETEKTPRRRLNAGKMGLCHSVTGLRMHARLTRLRDIAQISRTAQFPRQSNDVSGGCHSLFRKHCSVIVELTYCMVQ